MTQNSPDLVLQVLKLKQENKSLKNEVIEYVVMIRELEEEVRQLKTGLAIAENRA